MAPKKPSRPMRRGMTRKGESPAEAEHRPAKTVTKVKTINTPAGLKQVTLQKTTNFDDEVHPE